MCSIIPPPFYLSLPVLYICYITFPQIIFLPPIMFRTILIQVYSNSWLLFGIVT